MDDMILMRYFYDGMDFSWCLGDRSAGFWDNLGMVYRGLMDSFHMG